MPNDRGCMTLRWREMDSNLRYAGTVLTGDRQPGWLWSWIKGPDQQCWSSRSPGVFVIEEARSGHILGPQQICQ
jgi:hypothetical protein